MAVYRCNVCSADPCTLKVKGEEYEPNMCPWDSRPNFAIWEKCEPVKMVDWVKENYPDALFMDGYNDCIIGICHRFGQEPIVAYDQNNVVGKLVADGMTHDEAVEWFEFNQIGAWVGDTTPCFIEIPYGQ